MTSPAHPSSAPCIVIAVTVPMSVALFGGIPAELVRRGWRVHFVTGEPVDAARRVPGVEFYVVPMRRAIAPLADLGAVAGFRRLLLELCPDVVWAATRKASLVGLLMAGRRRAESRLPRMGLPLGSRPGREGVAGEAGRSRRLRLRDRGDSGVAVVRDAAEG